MGFCRVAVVVVGMVVALVPRSARADCAESPSYTTTVSNNTVSIGLAYYVPCPATSAMLREDVATGTVVELAYCGDTEESNSYVDECVAPGTYRYGLAVPYTCGGCGGTEYFAEATVTSPLPTNCMRSAGDNGPMTTSTPLPWGVGAEPSMYESCPHGCECDTATATVVGANSVALGAGVALLTLARRRRRRV